MFHGNDERVDQESSYASRCENNPNPYPPEPARRKKRLSVAPTIDGRRRAFAESGGDRLSVSGGVVGDAVDGSSLLDVDDIGEVTEHVPQASTSGPL